jgi:tetratricopeptide (TPR) repeat protein
MDAYELPEEFAHLQAQDMGKIGFINDVVRGIKKVVIKEEKQTVVKETVVTGGSANTASLLKRAFMFLEDSDWSSANEYCEKVLDIDPENAEAYLGKMMAELRVSKKEDLEFYSNPFDNANYYEKVMRFGDDKLVSEIEGYNTNIVERIEENRKAQIYSAGSDFANIKTPEKQLEAAQEFEKIPGYRDADERAKECRQSSLLIAYENALSAEKEADTAQVYERVSEMFFALVDAFPDAKAKAEECLSKAKEFAELEAKQAQYFKASQLRNAKDIPTIEKAIEIFESIKDFKDSENKLVECRMKISDIKAEDERRRILLAEKIEAEKKKKIISLSIILSIIIAIVTVCSISVSQQKKEMQEKNKRLEEALNNNKFTVEYVKENYGTLQNNKGALTVVANKLNNCYETNDLERALEIFTTLAESDCAFSNGYYDSNGKNFTEFKAHISGTKKLLKWLYEESEKQGERISLDGPQKFLEFCDYTYDVYGYKLTIGLDIYGEAFCAYLYVPSGWYEVDIPFHSSTSTYSSGAVVVGGK